MNLIIDLQVLRDKFPHNLEEEVEQFFIKLQNSKDNEGFLRNDLVRMG